MKRNSLSFRALFVVLAVVFTLTLQWNAAVANDTTKSGFIADLLGQHDRVKGKIVSLEGAVLQNKFSWRPIEGVRSFSEVYLHIVDANYLLGNAAGLKSPFENKTLMDEKTRDARTADAAKIAEALNASFDWTTSAIAKLTNADLEKMVNFFGSKMTVRNVLLSLLSHTHEHLAQSIADARSNGVVTPWTAQMQEEMKKNMPKKHYRTMWSTVCGCPFDDDADRPAYQDAIRFSFLSTIEHCRRKKNDGLQQTEDPVNRNPHQPEWK